MKARDPQVKIVYRSVTAKDGCLGENQPKPADPFRRAANEDDDGYDPYSDRPADPAPLFERDPWS